MVMICNYLKEKQELYWIPLKNQVSVTNYLFRENNKDTRTTYTDDYFAAFIVFEYAFVHWAWLFINSSAHREHDKR